MSGLSVRTSFHSAVKNLAQYDRDTKSFEPLLKEVVTAKRLSASKMSKLTDIALKNMEVRFDCLVHSTYL
jgi:hypothetical protein